MMTYLEKAQLSGNFAPITVPANSKEPQGRVGRRSRQGLRASPGTWQRPGCCRCEHRAQRRPQTERGCSHTQTRAPTIKDNTFQLTQKEK